MEHYVQGDLILIRMSDKPAEGKLLKDFVLLEGEGHNQHVIAEAKEVSTEWIEQAINELNLEALHVVSVEDETVVRHEPMPGMESEYTHPDLRIPAGQYVVRQQREFLPDIGIVNAYD